MNEPEDNTRPLSVAELLARNGTIGAPPISGRRRRKRRNSDGVSVAELTGEIPVIRTGEIPVVGAQDEEIDDEESDYEESDYEESDYEAFDEELGDEELGDGELGDGELGEELHYAESGGEESGGQESAYQESAYPDYALPESSEAVIVYVSEQVAVPEHAPETVEYDPADETEYVTEFETEYVTEEPVVDQVPAVEYVPAVEHEPIGIDDAVAEVTPASPPLANDPLPRREDRPELSHDPRPSRRSSGAEQMAYDPVDESVDLADLVDGDADQLRSYLRASQDTLFSGGTVADDLARGGIPAESAATDRAIEAVSAPPRQLGSTLWNSALAVLQSLLAVVVGAGLFIGFDQLWRWNNLVALMLSVLVVLTLAASVRVVRKTEDTVSTLTAVAVGLLVTLGPLALQST